jgi:CheY-like chemotaxis protein
MLGFQLGFVLARNLTMRNRVLVVDDCHYVAEAAARLIAVCGYETRTAYDGREAIERTMTFAPDLVLMDIGMPIVNGYEAALAIRREPINSHVLLVAVTCLDEEHDKQLAYESGFDLHVAKPVSLTTIHKILTLLHKRGSTSALASQSRAIHFDLL